MELGDDYFAAEEAKLDSKRKVKEEGEEDEDYPSVKEEDEDNINTRGMVGVDGVSGAARARQEEIKQSIPQILNAALSVEAG